ncbi:MAG: 4-hydroxythreonine-4-phosphate dehydrogenase PdxA [Gammaproteobacteria bacterium]|nr:4-hydroxythreonine-4-phosphate dehydrogenase PdxA [Gammaproteobacteria bacterium]
MSTLPRIAVTPGEPAGIGPDICLNLAKHAFDAQLVFVTDIQLLRERAQMLNEQVTVIPWDGTTRAHTPGVLSVLQENMFTSVRPGELDVANAQFVLNTLAVAVDACLDHTFDALVTGPVQKSVINDAGIVFSGHTEFLAQRCEAPLPVMMLTTENLRVALVTTHLPLREIPPHITRARVQQVLEILYADLQNKYGIDDPAILVCGLNPHAGEDGHLGTEEITEITPAITELRARGWNITGPLPADTLFTPRYLDDADAVLAMYHDQGLPVLKYAGFGNAINVTLGLPIIRTSVDHGTAMTLAGSGKANANSLILAVNTAIDMIRRRR